MGKEQYRAALMEHAQAMVSLLGQMRDERGFAMVLLTLDICHHGREAEVELHIRVQETPPLIRKLESDLASGE